MSSWVWRLRYYTAKPEESKWYRPSVKALLALGDTQLVTALALTVTSLIFITAEGDTSLYHIFVARGLVNVNLSGYGASLMLGTKDQCNFIFRWVLLLLFLVIYTVWTVLCINEFGKWSNKPPLCFQNENVVVIGTYAGWMRLDLFWCPIGFLWVLFEPFTALCEWLVWFDDDLPGKPWEYSKLFCKEWQSRTRNGPAKSDAYLNLVIHMVLLLLSVFGTLCVIITITPPFFTPFSQLFFFVWAVYDVFKVRQINAALGAVVNCPSDPAHWVQCMQNPEEQFGFGQILPFCLLLSSILQLADIYAEGKEEKDKARIGNLNRTKTL